MIKELLFIRTIKSKNLLATFQNSTVNCQSDKRELKNGKSEVGSGKIR